MHETYLFLAVCAGLNLLYFNWGNYGDAINSFLAIFFGVLIVAYPFFVAIFYRVERNYERILKKDVNFLARFGAAIADLNFKRKNKLVLVHCCTSVLRKLWLAHIVVF
jgi:hypothetical protein